CGTSRRRPTTVSLHVDGRRSAMSSCRITSRPWPGTAGRSWSDAHHHAIPWAAVRPCRATNNTPNKEETMSIMGNEIKSAEAELRERIRELKKAKRNADKVEREVYEIIPDVVRE